MTKRFWLTAVLMMILAVFSAAAQQAPPAPSDANVIGGDETQLRAFIARLFAAAPNVSVTTDVLIGAIPADVSPFVTLPPGASILGSVTTRGATTIAQVYADVGLPAALVAQYYRDTMAAMGVWRESSGGSSVGFEMGGAANLLFCGVSPSTSAMNIDIRPAPADTAQIGVTFQNGGDPRCSDTSAPVGIVMPSQVIPALTAPEGVTVLGAVSGGGTLDQYYSLTTLQSTLTPAAIAAQYNAQLTTLWALTSSTGDPSSAAATSTWTFVDANGGQWTGILVVAVSGMDVRTASLQVIKSQ